MSPLLPQGRSEAESWQTQAQAAIPTKKMSRKQGAKQQLIEAGTYVHELHIFPCTKQRTTHTQQTPSEEDATYEERKRRTPKVVFEVFGLFFEFECVLIQHFCFVNQ
jgi:hypothetical protein